MAERENNKAFIASTVSAMKISSPGRASRSRTLDRVTKSVAQPTGAPKRIGLNQNSQPKSNAASPTEVMKNPGLASIDSAEIASIKSVHNSNMSLGSPQNTMKMPYLPVEDQHMVEEDEDHHDYTEDDVSRSEFTAGPVKHVHETKIYKEYKIVHKADKKKIRKLREEQKNFMSQGRTEFNL